tara:strand:+ start:2333 stop:3445 length:1113 start_codon:yes stop_codon:yes gene_type:complete
MNRRSITVSKGWLALLPILGFGLLMTPPAWAGDGPVGYKKGFFIKPANSPFSLKVQGRVQSRFTYEGLEGIDKGADDEAAFAIQRARLKISGSAWDKKVTYKFQTDYGKGSVVLKDFYVNYALSKGLHIRTGQWKRPFSRQQITSSGKLELVDRAITDKAFGAGRDIGVAIHNNYEKSPGIEWVLGVFNGTGDKPVFTGSKFSNVPDRLHPTAVARLGYNHGGIKGYSEADFAGGPLRFALGASVLKNFDSDDSGDGSMAAEVDGIVKVQGLSLSGGFYTSFDADNALDTKGFHVQAGYLLSNKYQPVVRYAMIDPDGAANNSSEIALGLSVYFHKHNLKWQTDVASKRGEDVSISDGDTIVRSQLQLAF